MKRNLSHLMKAAWAMARKGARRYGGRAQSYIAVAMRLSWQRVSRSKVTIPLSILRTMKPRAAKGIMSIVGGRAAQVGCSLPGQKLTHGLRYMAANSDIVSNHEDGTWNRSSTIRRLTTPITNAKLWTRLANGSLSVARASFAPKLIASNVRAGLRNAISSLKRLSGWGPSLRQSAPSTGGCK